MYTTFKLNNGIELSESMGLGTFKMFHNMETHEFFWIFFELQFDKLDELISIITSESNVSKIGTDEYFAHNFEIFDGFITGRISHRIDDDGKLFFYVLGESDWLPLSFHCYVPS